MDIVVSSVQAYIISIKVDIIESTLMNRVCTTTIIIKIL